MKTHLAISCLAWCSSLLFMGIALAEEPVSVVQWIRDSDHALAASDYEQALHFARQATRQDPAHAPAWRQLGMVRLAQEAYQEAITAFEQAVLVDENDATTLRGLAKAQWLAEQRNQAIQTQAAYLRQQPNDLMAWRDQAVWLARVDRREDAVRILRKITELDPEDAATWTELGRLLYSQRNYAEALKAFASAFELDPDNPALPRDMGWCHWRMNARAEALPLFLQALQSGLPKGNDLLFQVVARLVEDGESSAALAFFTQAGSALSLDEAGRELVERGRLLASEPFLVAAWTAKEDRVPATGVYLAYARAINGHCTGQAEYLNPFVTGDLAQAPAELIDLALESLRLCGTRGDATALLDVLQEGLAGRADFSDDITALIERTADELRVRGNEAQALSLYRNALERSADSSVWITAFLLAEELEGPVSAEALARSVRERTSRDDIRTGIDGVLFDRDGNPEAAIEQLLLSLEVEPRQPILRQILFRNHLALGQIDEARQQTEWYARRVDEGESELRSYLAEMWMQLGDPESAFAQWQMLHMSRPDLPYYGIEAAYAQFRMCHPEMAKEILEESLLFVTHPQIYELLAEIESALGNPAQAAAYAARGLDSAPSRGLLRYHAENLEAAGLDPSNALHSALAHIAEDPGYVPMNLTATRMRSAVGQTNEARAHHEALLAGNPIFLPSLVYLRDDATWSGDFSQAVSWAEIRTDVQQGDPEALRVLANSLAQADRFPKSLRILKELAERPILDAVPILLYVAPQDCDYPGRIDAGQMVAHLERVHADGYLIDNRIDEWAEHAPAPRVVVIIADGTESVLQRVDAVLERIGGRAIYADSADALQRSIPGKPSPAFLRNMAASGRWQWAVTGPAPLARRTVDGHGTLGNPLTHSLYADKEGMESLEAYRERIALLLDQSSHPLTNQPARLWIYPSGDFGQQSIRSTDDHLSVLLAEVAARFDHGFYYSDSGFFISGLDTARTPARRVPPVWTPDDLMEHLTKRNPLVRARLEFAKVLYWHRQYERANHWFSEAEQVGAEPKEIYFNWGASYDNQGDIPRALQKLERAKELDPDNPRVDEIIQRAEDRKDGQARVFITAWEDNEDREYFQWGGTASLHAGNYLRLGVLADRNRWEQEGLGSEEGTRLGLSLKAFLWPEAWLEGRLWHLDMDDLPDHWGGEGALHLPSRWTAGFIELYGGRNEIETVEALRADIYADHYGIHSYSRLVNRFDLFMYLTQTERTDDNDTLMFQGRLLYRVREWPYVGLGYRFRFADSDFDPSEYWAPEELEQHQVHLNLRRTYGPTRLTLSGDAGYARERETDWRFVWGVNGTIETVIYRSLSAYVRGQYYESPTYNRTTYSAGLGLEF